ncbi:helix-turn-helix domain-containing protein [Pleomorphomonas carboxyditropha]|nr:helix-turn-helix transcriptional regulator [Pleomorphomonas carboxyditropha]
MGQQQGKRSAVAEAARGVARWRNRRGLTVEQLAQRSGIPTIVLFAIEGGQHDPAIDLLDGLASVLKVRLIDLFDAGEDQIMGPVSVDIADDL